ncbi:MULTISPECIES: DUF559 domain-containing protein [unclassified Treponema]|uniref:DUF559 domain-containing protein n=1 Tax=unclassified Treponema TaxID=2638727 RepID=UPI000E980066|nr:MULTISPECIES: DUF559 domain-containing protein [unclassified Treponema]HBP09138.1 hypothetical protein [Treponema sp.]
MKVKIDVEAKKDDSSKIDCYKISFQLAGDIEVSKKLYEPDMKELLDDIVDVLGYKPIMEKFNCTIKEAQEIRKKIDRDSDCKDCELKLKECYRCCNVCESPLERDLLKALVKNNIEVELQLRINKDNTVSHFPEPVDPENILTIPDFYLESDNKKICIYTDGHTYHERTEYQAVRDRSIDRELQNLGYVVLRFTTSEIRNGLSKVIKVIKKSIGITEENNFDVSLNNIKITEGTCIRCGAKISYDLKKPLCDDCYQVWMQFGNMDYTERYCCKCGKECYSTSYGSPLCKNCI